MLYPELQAYLRARDAEREEIRDERRGQLHRLARYVDDAIHAGESARLTFICTHNSRRSHFAQIWAAAAAMCRGVAALETYSGGTEATAFHPNAVAALERAGLRIWKTGDSENPIYEVRYGVDSPVTEAYSKTFVQPPNPQRGFAAVMTCSEADEACPHVPGAELRVSLPYEDPKAYDGTLEQAARYDERCRRISREMLYLFTQVQEVPSPPMD